MSKEFDEYIADKPELNLIPKEEVAQLKIKIGKNHRKEEDWDVIKEILLSHDVLTCEPFSKMSNISSFEQILCEMNALYIFTNIDDCERHIQDLGKKHGDVGEYFHIISLPFKDVMYLADEHSMDVYIDRQDEANSKCIVFDHRERQLKVMVLVPM